MGSGGLAMASALRFLLFGGAIWLIPFAIGLLVFPVAPPESALFDSLMSVAVSASAATSSWLYLRRREQAGFAGAALTGFGWALISVALDAPFFLFGPFRMPVPAYVGDIALAYLMIPIISGFIGLALRR